MGKSKRENKPVKDNDLMVKVRVINNFLDKTNNKKFMSVDDVYKTSKDRAEELFKLGYVVYVDDSDTNSNEDTNTDNSDANSEEDTNTDNSDANSDEDTNTDNSDANSDEDTNTTDSNVPNE